MGRTMQCARAVTYGWQSYEAFARGSGVQTTVLAVIASESLFDLSQNIVELAACKTLARNYRLRAPPTSPSTVKEITSTMMRENPHA